MEDTTEVAEVEEETLEVEEETPEETADVEDDIDEPVKEPEHPKPKKTVQERINEITRKRREAERAAEYWRQQAIEKEQKGIQTAKSGRPQQIDFDTVEDYEDALIEWHDHKRVEQTRAAEEARKTAEAVRVFNENAKDLIKEHDDFEDAINAPVFSDTMKKVIFSLESGPLLAYHLGKNKDIAMQMNNYPPEKQIYEMYRLETKLLMAQKSKPVTEAPTPIKPVGSTGISEKDPSDMSIDEWMAWDKKRQLEKLKHKIGE